MNDEDAILRLHDNPSIETQLALVVQALNRVTRGQAEDRNVLRELRDQVRTQNGNVAHLMEAQQHISVRQDMHDEHHGKGDIHIAERLTGLDVADHISGHEGRIAALEAPAHDASVRRKQLSEQIALVLAGAAAVPVLYGAYTVIAGLFG